jgi:hypothetical protein
MSDKYSQLVNDICVSCNSVEKYDRLRSIPLDMIPQAMLQGHYAFLSNVALRNFCLTGDDRFRAACLSDMILSLSLEHWPDVENLDLYEGFVWGCYMELQEPFVGICVASLLASRDSRFLSLRQLGCFLTGLENEIAATVGFRRESIEKLISYYELSVEQVVALRKLAE